MPIAVALDDYHAIYCCCFQVHKADPQRVDLSDAGSLAGTRLVVDWVWMEPQGVQSNPCGSWVDP
jgi:hypothetical protein